MEQTELLEILKTMSSLLQNFTEIIARGVGAEPGPRPLQRPPLWEGPGAQWPGGPSGQARWWLCPGMSPLGPQGLLRLRERTYGCRRVGLGGVAGPQGASFWGASFRAALRLRAPHIPRLEWKWW